MTPLHLAATQGQKSTVAALLSLGADPDAEGKERWPPLLWAAHKGHTGAVEVLCTASGNTQHHMQQARPLKLLILILQGLHLLNHSSPQAFTLHELPPPRLPGCVLVGC
jgi:ankyrin repeat protein